ncbi:MAG: AI-2E family transporter [Desulfobacterota bacterium]|nr:AI-2E family transporter [Thermodesulfobacteriota bacterium]
MRREHIFLIFILLLASLTFYYLYRILSPFLTPLLWAILLAIVFYPLFLKLQRFFKEKKVLPALIMTFFVLLLILLPAGLLIVALANEVIDFYHRLEEMIKTGQLQSYLDRLLEFSMVKKGMERLKPYVDVSQADPINFLLKNVQQISTFLFTQTSNLLRSISTFLVSFFFTLLSLYYFFKDGDRLLKNLREILPLRPKEREIILQRFKEMVSATIYGGILIAILQGALGGFSFWILGLSSPIFWGTAMAFLSFIPMGGTALIWGPAAILLLFQGAFLRGLLLLALGVLLIGMVDNFLRPLFVSSRTNIHPLLLFFSVLGGIQAFGMIGLVAGPLIMTLSLTLIEIYTKGIKTQGSSGP